MRHFSILIGLLLWCGVIRASEMEPTPDEIEKLRVQANSLHEAGTKLFVAAKYNEAVDKYAQRIEVLRKIHSEAKQPNGHPEIAKAIENLVVSMIEAGMADRAIPQAEQGLAMCRKIYPPEKFPQGLEHIASIMGHLGRALEAAGQPARAKPILEEALNIQTKRFPRGKFPDGHMELALALNNYGMVLASLVGLAINNDRNSPGVFGEPLAHFWNRPFPVERVSVSSVVFGPGVLNMFS